MKPEIARALARQLNDAAAAAEAEGRDEISLADALQLADDKARAEMQAAIDAAAAGGSQ